MGNLRSVSKALEHLGAKPILTSSKEKVKKADKIILPGVGAFGDAMKELKKLRLIDPIRDHVKSEKKLLGVCLGLQLLFEESEENKGVKGLGLIPGKIERFKTKKLKIPHMGWNEFKTVQKHPLLKGIPSKNFFYFIHSYYANPKNKKDVLGTCRYGKENFAAVVGNKQIFAAQFHPEKSQDLGLKILKNFIEW